MIPASAARSGTRGRPPLRAGGGGRRGAISIQRASDTRGTGIGPLYDKTRTMRRTPEGTTVLKDLLADWADFDAAEYYLAVSLGLMADEPGPLRHKWVFWSNNPTGEMLGRWLRDLVALGVLQENDDQQFRFSPDYVPPWEPTPDQ
jgi:hypothetical protein